MRPLTYFLIISAAGLVGGCGPDASGAFRRPPDAELSVLSLESVTTIGLDEHGPPEALFRFIRDAALGPAGDVAVLASDPPYLRVFSPEGVLRWSALPHGDGPSESRGGHALAVSSAGYLVLGHRRLHAVGHDGDVLFSKSISTILTHDVGPGCDATGWTLYGEGRERDSDGRVGWLFAVAASGRGLEALVHDKLAAAPQRPHSVSIRKVGNRLRFDHPYGARRGLLEFDCGTGELERVGATPLRHRFFTLDNDPRRASTAESATLSSGSVLAVRRYDLPAPVYAGYDFRWSDPDVDPVYRGRFTAEHRGSWRSLATEYGERPPILLDHDEEAVVLRGSTPVHHVLIVSIDSLRQYLAPAAGDRRLRSN